MIEDEDEDPFPSCESRMEELVEFLIMLSE
jgi:hypothetical protein